MKFNKHKELSRDVKFYLEDWLKGYRKAAKQAKSALAAK